MVTGPNALAVLDRVAYHPFSDFLLHDMASLGDGITQNEAGVSTKVSVKFEDVADGKVEEVIGGGRGPYAG